MRRRQILAAKSKEHEGILAQALREVGLVGNPLVGDVFATSGYIESTSNGPDGSVKTEIKILQKENKRGSK